MELQERLVVENYRVDFTKLDASFFEAIANSMLGEAGIVLLAGKALFLGRRYNMPVCDQRGRAVVIERLNAENAHLRAVLDRPALLFRTACG